LADKTDKSNKTKKRKENGEERMGERYFCFIIIRRFTDFSWYLVGDR